MLELVFGWLIVSATSPSSLAEERTRGSLDMLLATPMSTRSIVAGKWCGAFRTVFILALLPLYSAIFMAAVAPAIPGSVAVPRGFASTVAPLTLWDRIIGPTLTMVDFFASGAVIVSLGLALATWIRRSGRSIAASVSAYFFLGFGWLAIIAIGVQSFAFSNRGSWLQRHMMEVMIFLASLSPIYGTLLGLDEFDSPRYAPRMWRWFFLAVVILIKSAAAWLVFWLTVKSFDRCVGRVPDSGSRMRQSPKIRKDRASRFGESVPHPPVELDD
jgi:ABC-type Na+ efflux pump permease subunit